MSLDSNQVPEEAIDLIWGVSAIARVIGRTDRQTFHMVSNGEIPARKVGNRWVIDRSKLVAIFTGKAA